MLLLLYHRAHFFSAIAAGLLILLSLASVGQPPNLAFESYDTRQGLSQNLVFSIVQDKKGFLWLGTDEGLNRFDGYEFKIFRYDDKNPNSVIDNSIHALEVDNEGTLWIGTTNGLTRYYPDKELFEQLPMNEPDPAKPNGTSVNEIKKDNKGRIWIAYLGAGVDVYDPQLKQFVHYSTSSPGKNKIINDYVIALQFLPNGDKLLGTRQGIQFLSPDDIPLTNDQANAKYPWRNNIDNSITSFQLSKDGRNLYIGSELSGFFLVDLQSSEVLNFNTSNSGLKFNNNVPTLFEDSHGNVWIGAEAIYLFDKEKNIVTSYNESGIQGNVINKNPVLSIFEDKDHNIWFGTFRFGVLKHNPDNTKILHFHTQQGEKSIGNNQILSFNEDRLGNLWVGTDGGGLFRLRNDLKGFDKPELKTMVRPDVIKCIYRDNEGFFWIGTWDAGMIKYHPEKQSLQQFNPEHGNFESRHVWDIKPDGTGNLWIGTLRDGLVYFNTSNNRYTYYKSIPGDTTSLVNNDIMCLFVDSRKMLWIGTSDGLSILKSGAKHFTNFQKRYLNVTVLTMYEDKNNKMWLGTNGGGVVIVDGNLKIERSISEKDGLPSSTVCSIQPDGKENIWVSTYNGIVKISKDGTITQVPEIAGLQGKEFIPRSGFKWKNGQLLFGGVNGFNLFHPDSLKFNPKPELPVLTSLKINNDEISPTHPYRGRQILTTAITEIENLSLSYKDYSFTLSFSSLSFNWQNNLQYKYFLEGLDNEWQYTTAAKRYIHYTNLDPRSYVLKIKTSYDGKVWSEETKELKITITPPWWATWWFRVISAALLIFLLFLIYQTRVRFLKKQKDKLEKLVIERTHELQKSNEEIQLLLEEVADKKEKIEEHMHELRQVNEEISAQRDTLEHRSTELEKAQKKLREINATLEVLVDKRTQKLSDALRELETFLYRASHDLRGPISSMLGLIGVARLEKDPIRYNQMYTDFLQKTVQGLDRTLQKLVQKHTIEKKKIYPENINKVSFLMLLEEILKDIPFYRTDDLDLKVDDHMKIVTDKMLLGIILTNLLENAFFYSHQAVDKKVHVGVHQNNENTKIIIEDHGPGIKDEIKDKIFTMFYRGHELSTGNGLGLYLVKNVLTKVNGTINVETEERVFSRFIISLPSNGHSHA